MQSEIPKRPRRNPLTPEEVADIIAFRKKKEHVRLLKLKRSRSYMLQNIFNVLCFCIYTEILLCYLGPATYESHIARDISVNYQVGEQGRTIISDMEVVSTNGTLFKIIVNDSIHVPSENSVFYIGKDFLLRKELKAEFEDSDIQLRMFKATPALVLCGLIALMSVVAYSNNLNENAYSLLAITVMNALTVLGVGVL